MALSAVPVQNYRNLDLVKQNEAVVKAGVTVYEGGFYALEVATGQVIVATNAAGQRPLGFAYLTYAAGDKAMFQYNMTARIPLSGVAATAIRALVYATSDNVFTTTAGSATTPVGRITAVYDDECDVDVTLV